MRISTAIPIFVTLAGVNADGARKKRLAKPSKSGSAGSMDAVSSWASAPAPATWGPAPTWAAPAPAPATWTAPATWAAPSPAVPTDGCRAVWLSPSVSESTFSADLCSLSGWWKAKLATHGTIDNDNSIDSTTTGYQEQTNANVGTPGYQFLYSIPKITDVDSNTSNDNYSIPGFIDDMTNDSRTNPLTTTGVSYCECWAVTQHNCDPDYTILVNTNPGAGQMTSTTDYAVSDNFAEYQVIQVALKRIADHKDDNNIATTTPVTIDKQSEADEVSALLNNLPSKLNNCAIFSQASIDSN